MGRALSDEGGGASRSTDPAFGSSAATDVSLREYVTLMVEAEMRRVNQRFAAVEKATTQAFENSQRAIDKADAATEKRFEGVNEFRAALADQAANFVTRQDLVAITEKFEVQIDALKEARDLNAGQDAGSRLAWGTVVTLIGVTATVIAILSFVITFAATQ